MNLKMADFWQICVIMIETFLFCIAELTRKIMRDRIKKNDFRELICIHAFMLKLRIYAI